MAKPVRLRSEVKRTTGVLRTLFWSQALVCMLAVPQLKRRNTFDVQSQADKIVGLHKMLRQVPKNIPMDVLSMQDLRCHSQSDGVNLPFHCGPTIPPLILLCLRSRYLRLSFQSFSARVIQLLKTATYHSGPPESTRGCSATGHSLA